MTDEPTQGTCDECHRLHLPDNLIVADGDWLSSRCSGHVSLIVLPGDPSEISRLRAIEAAALQWFSAHQAVFADRWLAISLISDCQRTALRRLAELLAG
jgi:hypothetical protein